MAQHRQNVYTSVLLREGYTLTDLVAGCGLEVGPPRSPTGWHLDNHCLPTADFHLGGGPTIWFVFTICIPDYAANSFVLVLSYLYLFPFLSSNSSSWFFPIFIFC
jgi:hypothetical protein